MIRLLPACLLFLTSCAAPPPSSPVGFDWREFGRRNRGDVDGLVARFACEVVRLGIEPNCDAAGRDRAHRRWGDSSIGTCGHLSRALREALEGAGLGAGVRILGAARLGLDGRPMLDLNCDHAAVAVPRPGGAVVFDLWMEGRERRGFAGFASSPWNAMPQAEWEARMAKLGYALEPDRK
ncbi:MAG: hypothetical protein HYY17_03225 [Planctomycetes bacterium]|nr:hypothetical protein [Planctomycetota bacterium]